MEKHLIVYTDGGARGNPGPAGLGVYIVDTAGREIDRVYHYLGKRTNNQAEYLGALVGVRRAIELGATDIDLRMDSELIIKQLLGKYRVRNPELSRIKTEILSTLSRWSGHIRFTHIPRSQNCHADRLANRAMIEAGEPVSFEFSQQSLS